MATWTSNPREPTYRSNANLLAKYDVSIVSGRACRIKRRAYPSLFEEAAGSFSFRYHAFRY